jgi:hypothetical protein
MFDLLNQQIVSKECVDIVIDTGANQTGLRVKETGKGRNRLILFEAVRCSTVSL